MIIFGNYNEKMKSLAYLTKKYNFIPFMENLFKIFFRVHLKKVLFQLSSFELHCFFKEELNQLCNNQKFEKKHWNFHANDLFDRNMLIKSHCLSIHSRNLQQLFCSKFEVITLLTTKFTHYLLRSTR